MPPLCCARRIWHGVALGLPLALEIGARPPAASLTGMAWHMSLSSQCCEMRNVYTHRTVPAVISRIGL
jgi:hypothetical protein